MGELRRRVALEQEKYERKHTGNRIQRCFTRGVGEGTAPPMGATLPVVSSFDQGTPYNERKEKKEPVCELGSS